MQLDACLRRSRRSQAGFTLMEILVSTAIALVALTTAGAFNRFQLFSLRTQANQLDLQTTARNVVDLFAREVRQAGFDPNCAKTFSGVATASAAQLRILSDLNANGMIDGTNEDITYAFTTRQLARTTVEATDVLISDLDVTGSRFRYYDSAGTEIIPGSGQLSSAQRAAVQRVRIELVVTGQAADPLNLQPLKAQASSNVDIRNRFFIGGTGCT
jgi:prepilin-type N-terminal cleavage/methylation domain-containing protein